MAVPTTPGTIDGTAGPASAQPQPKVQQCVALVDDDRNILTTVSIALQADDLDLARAGPAVEHADQTGVVAEEQHPKRTGDPGGEDRDDLGERRAGDAGDAEAAFESFWNNQKGVQAFSFPDGKGAREVEVEVKGEPSAKVVDAKGKGKRKRSDDDEEGEGSGRGKRRRE